MFPNSIMQHFVPHNTQLTKKKNQCYHCKEPRYPGHQCEPKTLNQIIAERREVLAGLGGEENGSSDEEEEELVSMIQELKGTEENEEEVTISLNALEGSPFIGLSWMGRSFT